MAEDLESVDYQSTDVEMSSNDLNPTHETVQLDQVVAIDLYESERDDEIDIEVNDVISVLKRRYPKWWHGHNERTGQTGLFPLKVVQPWNSYNSYIEMERMISIEPLLSQTDDAIQNVSLNEHCVQEVEESSENEEIEEVEEGDIYFDSFDSDSEDEENNYVSLGNSQLFPIRVMSENPDSNHHSNDTDQSSQQRFYVIGELIETEENYVKQLNFTLQNFSNLIQKSRVMSAEKFNIIFEHLRQIYEINNSFYENLKLRNEDNTECLIGSTLVNYFEQMLPIYKNYCSNNVAELLSKINESEHVEAELQHISTETNSHKTFKSELVRPMQRITKYPLLVEKLLKNTLVGHPDNEDCQRAFDCSKLLCKKIDKIYGKMCLQVEPFKKLRWIQTHVFIPIKRVDQTIDFISETRFLGPRILLHSGIVSCNSKMYFAFLFNDFFLLAKPNKPPQSISEGIDNLFENDDTRHLKCTLHEKPFLLNDLQVEDLDELESTLNSNLFRLEVKSLKKHISLHANSMDEWIDWVQQINLAKHNYTRTEQLFRNNDNASIQTPHQNPIATFKLTSVEAFQLYCRNYALNAYCKVALGRDWSQSYSTSTTDTVRRVMDFRNPTTNQQKTKKSLLSKLKTGVGKKFANNNDTIEDPHRLFWELNSRFNVYHSDDILFIRCYDANPFAPHQFLGEAKLAVREIVQNRSRFTNKGLTKLVNLDMPNEQLSQNFLQKLNIRPYLSIRFDQILNTHS